MARSPIFEERSAGWQTWRGAGRRVRIWRRIPISLGTIGFLVALLVVSAVAALVGGVLARRMLTVDAPLTAVVPTGHQAESEGLLLQVADVRWLALTPAQGPRLLVDFRLQNPTNRSHAVGRQEFHLYSGSGGSWPASDGSISATMLGARQTLTGTLLFDVPATVPSLQLVWISDRHEVRIPIVSEASRHTPQGAIDGTR